MAEILLTDVTKRFGTTLAVDAVNLSITDAEKQEGCQQALIEAAETRRFEATRLRKRKPRVIARRISD